MDWGRLRGEQYVRLTAAAAAAIAPFVGIPADQIEELALDLADWPEDIRPSPLKGRDGRLIAGDPMLVDVSDAGLFFAPEKASRPPILVKWRFVNNVRVLGREQASA